MRYHIIADSATVKGFSIFGVSGTVVELPHETSLDVSNNASDSVSELTHEASLDVCVPTIVLQAQKAFENALFIENLGVLILSAPVADLIRPQVEAYIKTGHFPQILVLWIG